MPWTALFKRKQCHACSVTRFYQLERAGWHPISRDEWGRIGGYYLNFDRLGNYVKEEAS